MSQTLLQRGRELLVAAGGGNQLGVGPTTFPSLPILGQPAQDPSHAFSSSPSPSVPSLVPPPELSSRVSVLLDECRSLLSHSPSSRILVFVQRRSSARALASLLSRLPDMAPLRPALLVGHSGFDGMSWEEEQRPVLRKFRVGLVRLVVATSVAEEGLDIPACNMVVRFDYGAAGAVTAAGGANATMTAVVQSRGRARAAGSRFVVLLEPADVAAWEEVRLKEENMMRAVQQVQEEGRRRGGTGGYERQGEVVEVVSDLAKQLEGEREGGDKTDTERAIEDDEESEGDSDDGEEDDEEEGYTQVDDDGGMEAKPPDGDKATPKGVVFCVVVHNLS